MSSYFINFSLGSYLTKKNKTQDPQQHHKTIHRGGVAGRIAPSVARRRGGGVVGGEDGEGWGGG